MIGKADVSYLFNASQKMAHKYLNNEIRDYK